MNEFARPYFKSSIVEFWGATFDQLNDPNYFRESCIGLFEELEISLISGPHIKQFKPQGLSMAAIFEESHGAFHTWPEHGYARGQIEVCSPKVELVRLPELLSHYFDYRRVILYNLESVPIQEGNIVPSVITTTLYPHYITHHPPVAD